MAGKRSVAVHDAKRGPWMDDDADAVMTSEDRKAIVEAVESWTAKIRVERSGQLTPSGQPLGTRHTTHLRVFARSHAGWKIVSHLISDARGSERPHH